MRSFAASALGPIVTSVFQIVTVPIYLHSWGTHLYGEWLILSAVPAYLSLTDFGFASVAANTMTMDVARGDKEAALRTFQSAWLLTTVVAGLVFCIVLCATPFPLHTFLKLHIIAPREVKLIFVLLSLQVLIGLQSNLNQAGFRADGNYAFGVLCLNVVRLLEASLVSVFVLLGASPVLVAATMLVVRTLGMTINRILLKKKSGWLTFGFSHAEIRITKSLFLPALGYMAFPLGDAISIQGITLAIGMVIGPLGVVTFSTLRTLSRLVIQAIRIVMYSIAPEMSVSYGRGDWPETRRLHRISCQLSLWTSVSASSVLLVFGNLILNIWTHHRIQMDYPTFWFLLLVVVANSVWHGSSALLLASSLHNRAAAIYLIVTALSLLAAIALMKMIGLSGAAASLLLVDLLYGTYVVNCALRILKESPSEWLHGIMRVPRILTRAGTKP